MASEALGEVVGSTETHRCPFWWKKRSVGRFLYLVQSSTRKNPSTSPNRTSDPEPKVPGSTQAAKGVVVIFVFHFRRSERKAWAQLVSNVKSLTHG